VFFCYFQTWFLLVQRTITRLYSIQLCVVHRRSVETHRLVASNGRRAFGCLPLLSHILLSSLRKRVCVARVCASIRALFPCFLGGLFSFVEGGLCCVVVVDDLPSIAAYLPYRREPGARPKQRTFHSGPSSISSFFSNHAGSYRLFIK